MSLVYLDNAATSFPKPPQVLDAMRRWFEELGVDAARGSSERHEAVAVVVAECRRSLGRLTGVRPDRVVFCSGATEALNLYLKGTLRPGSRVWTTRLEHNAVVRPLIGLQQRQGVEVRFFEPEGPAIRPDQVRAALASGPPPDLFVYNHASNVTGQIQDLSPVAAELRAAGACILADCAQSAGRLDLTRLDVDALVVPGHKGLYGPPGIGALCLRADSDLVPLREGGTGSSRAADRMPAELPAGLEGGTPNTPAIFGWRAGIEWVAARGFERTRRDEMAAIRALRDELEDHPRVRLIGAGGPDTHVAVLSLVHAELDPTELAMILEQHGVLVRAGFHCAPYVHGCIDTSEAGTVRFSAGAFNTEDEARSVAAIVRKL